MVRHTSQVVRNITIVTHMCALMLLGAFGMLGLTACAHDGGSSQAQEQAADASAASSDAEGVFEFTGSTSTKESTKDETSKSEPGKVDYLVLVNKTHELDEDWEKSVDLVEVTNQRGKSITVERAAAEAFDELQKALKQEGVVIDLNSCYRSRKEQQKLVDQFTQEYGSDYVEKYVAKAGHSEHETGLALDVIPIVNGVEMLTNEEMLAQKDLWNVVHTTMPKYGFILRYLPDQEAITGYEYEPWHLRYVGTPDAQEIADSGLTLEEYLDKK